MPELDPLPPPPRRPVLTPRPGDFDDMTRRVTRRRNARYGAAGSAVAVAAAVVLIANGGAPGIDTITAEPATTSTATASASATPSASGSATPTPSPMGEPTSAPATPSGAPSAAGPTATAAPSPSAVPPGEQPPPPVPSTRHASFVRDDVAYTPGTCAGAGDPGWCVRVPSSRTVQSGEPADYLIHACRLPGSGEGTLSFYSPDEIAFAMYDQAGVERYRWGRPNYARETHRATVGSGRCARWTFTYDATDSAGTPLKPGDYSAGVGIDAWFSGPATGSSAYGIAVRVVD